MNTLILLAPFFLAQTPPQFDDNQLRSAIEKGLERLEAGARNYPKNRQCFSCHHQALPMMALNAAKERGFSVDDKLIQEQINFTLKSFASKKGLEKGQGVGGASTTVAYALTALAAGHHVRDDTVQAMTEFLLVRQNRDGSWTAQAKRPPSEGSPFTSTALALHSLKVYPAIDKGVELAKRMALARSNGQKWLRENTPDSTEDMVFHLQALLSIDAKEAEIEEARNRLLAKQLGDGSWAQLPDMKGDAYATGSVLVMLRKAALPLTHPAYQRGVGFLLSTQKEDGSWFVQTRSRPIQTFFDNGDPGGPSQFISFPATGWAVLALLEAAPLKK